MTTRPAPTAIPHAVQNEPRRRWLGALFAIILALGTSTLVVSAKRECISTSNATDLWDAEFQKCIPLYCPLMIAVGTDQAYTLTTPQLGVAFDIDANGTLEQIAWTEPNEEIAFLALDRNGDGTINDGRELFGDHTFPGVKNGFDALRRMTMETNGGITRGEVGSDDPIFARLLLWTDRNHNGLSEAGELRPAADVVSRIGLGYTPFDRRDGNGNRFRFRGFVYVRTAPGVNLPSSYRENKDRTRSIYDVFLRVQP